MVRQFCLPSSLTLVVPGDNASMLAEISMRQELTSRLLSPEGNLKPCSPIIFPSVFAKVDTSLRARPLSCISKGSGVSALVMIKYDQGVFVVSSLSPSMTPAFDISTTTPGERWKLPSDSQRKWEGCSSQPRSQADASWCVSSFIDGMYEWLMLTPQMKKIVSSMALSTLIG